MKVIDVRIAVMEIAKIMAYEANMENGGAGHHFTKGEFMDVAEAMLENVPMIEAEPNSCKYWDSESHFCALRRPQAEPVRSARWINNGNNTWSCSRCRSWLPDEQHSYARYCLFCGARMEDDDE